MKISVGLGSYVGYGLSALATLGALDSAIVQNFPSTGKWCALAATVLAGLTTLGRQLQAAAGNPTPSAAEDASQLVGLVAQAQANVVKVASAPDGIDSPTVPFSGAQAPATPPAA